MQAGYLDKFNKQIPFNNRSCHICGNEKGHKGMSWPKQIWSKWKHIGHSVFGCGKIEFKKIGSDISKKLENDPFIRSIRGNEVPPNEPTFLFDTPFPKSKEKLPEEICSTHMCHKKCKRTVEEGWFIPFDKIQTERHRIIKEHLDIIKENKKLLNAYNKLRKGQENPSYSDFKNLTGSEVSIIRTVDMLIPRPCNSNPFWYKWGLNNHAPENWKSFTSQEVEIKGLGVFTHYTPTNLNNCSNSMQADMIGQRIQEYIDLEDDEEEKSNENHENLSNEKSVEDINVQPDDEKIKNWGTKLLQDENSVNQVNDVNFKNIYMDPEEIWKVPSKNTKENSPEVRTERKELYILTTQKSDDKFGKKKCDYSNRRRDINKFRLEAKQNVEKVMKEDSMANERRESNISDNNWSAIIKIDSQWNINLNAENTKGTKEESIEKKDDYKMITDLISLENKSKLNIIIEKQNLSLSKSENNSTKKSWKSKIETIKNNSKTSEDKHGANQNFNEPILIQNSNKSTKNINSEAQAKSRTKSNLSKQSKTQKEVEIENIDFNTCASILQITPCHQSEEIKLDLSETSLTTSKLSSKQPSYTSNIAIESQQPAQQKHSKSASRRKVINFRNYKSNLHNTDNDLFIPYPVSTVSNLESSPVASRSSNRQKKSTRNNVQMNSEYLNEMISWDSGNSNSSGKDSSFEAPKRTTKKANKRGKTISSKRKPNMEKE